VTARWGAAAALDWTLAARTGLFDVDAATWSAEMTSAAAVDAHWLTEVPFSECVPCGTPIGTVSGDAAERLRVPSGTALVAGAHDQAASFIGAGGRAGSVSTFALGSSDCLTVETPQRPTGIAGTGFATYPWRPARWLTLAGTAAGGWTLDWYVALTGVGDADALLSESSTEPPPVIVLPYLAGSGTLDNDPSGRGAVIGLTLDLSRAQLTRAFLEAAGYELASIVERSPQPGAGRTNSGSRHRCQRPGHAWHPSVRRWRAPQTGPWQRVRTRSGTACRRWHWPL
jgi:sugar (pentulose or hexulose) kinase